MRAGGEGVGGGWLIRQYEAVPSSDSGLCAALKTFRPRQCTLTVQDRFAVNRAV